MPSPYARFNEALTAVPFERQAEVRELRQAATAYVWGWQDATPGADHDTDESIRFGYAYGIVAARYASEVISVRPNIADAWKSWQAHGEIRYFAFGREQALDAPTVPSREAAQ